MSGDLKICSDLASDKKQYCETLVQSCVDQHKAGKPKITLDLKNGSTRTFTDEDDCRYYSHLRAKQGVPKGIAASTNPRGTTTSLPTTSSAGSLTTPGSTLPAPTNTSHPAFKNCNAIGPKGSSGFTYCHKLIGICVANNTGPYLIPNGTGQKKLTDQDDCIYYALNKAKVYAPKSHRTSHTGPSATSTSNVKFKADNTKRFAATFHQASFEPSISDKVLVKDVTLLFKYSGRIKGTKIELAYKLIKQSDTSYTIKYRIYSGKESAPKKVVESDLDKVVAFAVSGKEIQDDLAFGVELTSAGDFSSVESIDIVKL